ncbi:hypothetical protein [Sphingobacterium zeae]|uniref:Tetratricopeptide repeat-containing protein n=1 Tax=Sphingobacterium zeae TaxID=1776859 RepID=A0ABU0U9N6_9SPHI|nr:hypothetical protein [Sphingobacterium zeae]MDQ1151562.1 hypothetical protein [Sphingobacterium zeae]
MITRIVIIIVLFCLSKAGFGQQVNIDKIRREYAGAVKDEDLCEHNLKVLKEGAKSPTDKVYLAAYQILLAKHIGNPFKKVGQFKEGKNYLEEVIKENPNHIEARFIRWSVQVHAPSFLGYNNNILEDKNFLVKNLYKLPNEEAKSIIYNYLKGANPYLKGGQVFSATELKELAQ